MLRAVTLLCLVAIARGQSADCLISLQNFNLPNSLPDPSPLLLKLSDIENEYQYNFIQPLDNQGNIKITHGSQIKLACPGPYNYLLQLQEGPIGKWTSLVNDAIFSCSNGEFKSVAKKSYNFRDLACLTHPEPIAIKTTTKCNKNLSKVIEIGFNLTRSFQKVMEVCYDEENKNAIYSKFDLLSGIGGAETDRPSRPVYFRQDKFYPGINVNEQYQNIMRDDVFYQSLDVNHIGNGGSIQYLQRAQLTSSSDFVYVSQRRATFYYVNVAPQWQSFSSNGWNILERNIRLYASEKGLDLTIYTGTRGISLLNGTKEFYLSKGSCRATDQSQGCTKQSIPVPKLIWKVVYSKQRNEGVAIIGVNTPYFDTTLLNGPTPAVEWSTENDVKNICNKLTKDGENQYISCLKISTFKEVVPNILPNNIKPRPLQV